MNLQLIIYYSERKKIVFRSILVTMSMSTKSAAPGGKLPSLSQSVSSNEDNVQGLQNRLQQLEKENAYLANKVEDLEK